MTDQPDQRSKLHETLALYPTRIVACSGGIDSLVLATLAHRAAPEHTVVAHTVTPAVPGPGTARVVAFGEREGWNLELVRSNEFDDERYLANPADRCYYCKSNLYAAIAMLQETRLVGADAVILSGANTDDLGEYRPGLVAAAEQAVHHPYIESGWAKNDVRAAARVLGLAEADLPASPCLASRLYTGTRVTAARLQAVEVGEALVTQLTGIGVVRCRIRDEAVHIEVMADDRHLIDNRVVAAVRIAMTSIEPGLESVVLDEDDYRAGRSFLRVS